MEDKMIIVEMKKHFQLRAIEWWSAGLMTSWGVWMLLFPNIFNENPAFQVMGGLAPQRVWGLVALFAGGIRLCALFINGMWTRTPAVRWFCAMVSVLIWFIMTAAFFSADVINAGPIIYGWHMLADMYSAFRSSSDYVEAEAQRKLKKMAVHTLPSGEAADNVRRLSTR